MEFQSFLTYVNVVHKLFYTTETGRRYYVTDWGAIKVVEPNETLQPYLQGMTREGASETTKPVSRGVGEIVKPAVSNGYSRITIKDGEKLKTFLVHRLVAEAFCKKNNPTDNVVDHIDGDTSNNRATNLRWCTQKDNSRNRKKSNNTSSKYKGVYWCAGNNKFRAQICVDYKRIQVGYYENEEDAGRAYDLKALEHFGQFARLNFPLSNYIK